MSTSIPPPSGNEVTQPVGDKKKAASEGLKSLMTAARATEAEKRTGEANLALFQRLKKENRFLSASTDTNNEGVLLPPPLAWLGIPKRIRNILEKAGVSVESLRKNIEECQPGNFQEKFPKEVLERFSNLYGKKYKKHYNKKVGGSHQQWLEDDDYKVLVTDPLTELTRVVFETKLDILTVDGFESNQLFVLNMNKKIKSKAKRIVFNGPDMVKAVLLNESDEIAQRKRRRLVDKIEENESKYQKRPKRSTSHSLLRHAEKQFKAKGIKKTDEEYPAGLAPALVNSCDSNYSCAKITGELMKIELDDSEMYEYELGPPGSFNELMKNCLSFAGGPFSTDTGKKRGGKNISWRPYFLATQRHDFRMQKTHTDYSFDLKKYKKEENPFYAWNADLPLTSEGSAIYLWPGFSKGRRTSLTDKGKVKYSVLQMKFGQVLFRRGDVAHAGCLPGFDVNTDAPLPYPGIALRLHCSVGPSLLSAAPSHICTTMSNGQDYSTVCEAD